jgi:glycosyltransferase involved in cell wall biosynthesis
MPAPDAGAGFDQLVVIDGGSTDGTIEYFETRNIPVYTQKNRGRGDAFLKAFTDIESDAYIFYSPDGNEAVADLGQFRERLTRGADIVIASRMMEGAVNEEDGDILRWRKWANKAFTLLANLGFRRKGPYITDTINGYRAISRQAVNKLKLDAVDYTIEFQMTLRALKAGMVIVEFPTHEGERIAGETGAPSIPTGLHFIRCMTREFFRPAP